MEESMTGTVRRLKATNEGLMRTNEELKRFAYGAAHDLKAPLRGIEQLAGFLMEDVGEDLPEASRRHVERITARARQLTEMVDGLLQFATLAPGELPRESVDVEAACRALWELHDPDGFVLETHLEVPMLLAPRAAVQRVLNNLITNALRHHDRDEGTVRVTTRRAGSVVVLTVEDDGPGIPEHLRDKALELYGTVRKGSPGHGLGLALVQRTVAQLGGTVDLTERAPRGLRVVVRWPAT